MGFKFALGVALDAPPREVFEVPSRIDREASLAFAERMAAPRPVVAVEDQPLVEVLLPAEGDSLAVAVIDGAVICCYAALAEREVAERFARTSGRRDVHVLNAHSVVDFGSDLWWHDGALKREVGYDGSRDEWLANVGVPLPEEASAAQVEPDDPEAESFVSGEELALALTARAFGIRLDEMGEEDLVDRPIPVFRSKAGPAAGLRSSLLRRFRGRDQPHRLPGAHRRGLWGLRLQPSWSSAG